MSDNIQPSTAFDSEIIIDIPSSATNRRPLLSSSHCNLAANRVSVRAHPLDTDTELAELVAAQKRSALRLAVLECRVANIKYLAHQNLSQDTKEAAQISIALRKDINSARLKVEQLQLGPTLPLEIVAMILWWSLGDEGNVGPRPSQLAKLSTISYSWNRALRSTAKLWNTVEYTFTSRTSYNFGDGLASLVSRGAKLGLHIVFHCMRSEDACAANLALFWETVAPYTRSLTVAAPLWEDWLYAHTHPYLDFPKLQLLHMEKSRGEFWGSSAYNLKYLFGGSFPLLSRCVFIFCDWDEDDDPEELTEGLVFVVNTLKTLTLSSSHSGQAHWLKQLTLPCLEELSVQPADVEQLGPFLDRSQPPLTTFTCEWMEPSLSVKLAGISKLVLTKHTTTQGLSIASLLDPVVLPNLSELNISQRHPIGNWDIIWDVMNRRREKLKSIIIRSHSMGLN
ncbi:hypothetical protein R3P38DRAFT_3199343 [Favolaschia claudopus]|uniref:F-box domain-containing protein n=1 Tax=Favolaschia claudopus TaxID=2862362 RepID=A0AAW0B2B1_9AGAR